MYTVRFLYKSLINEKNSEFVLNPSVFLHQLSFAAKSHHWCDMCLYTFQLLRLNGDKFESIPRLLTG